MGAKRRGNSLVTTLMGGAVLFMLVATVAAVVFQHANFAATSTNQQMARDHAESAVNLAIQKLLDDPAYGQTPSDEVFRFSQEGEPGEGMLTFFPDRADELGIPRSVNNFGRSAPSDNDGRVCPGECVQLIGVGTCNGARRTVQVLVHVPTFPWVVGSSGTFHTEGICLVARVPPGIAPDDVAQRDLLPGDIGSNSSEPDAIVLSPHTVVKGDVQAVGRVVLEPGAVVEGALRPGSDPAMLPDLRIEDYDPRAQGQPDVQALPPGAFSGTLTGPAVVDGDLNVTGGLVLDGGWLYVDGQLTITGGVSGKGALVVTGDSRISGQIDLQADNQVAMLAGGDIELHGEGKSTSQFRGQVYTEGNFLADNVTVVGNFIANSPDPAKGKITLKDARTMLVKPADETTIEPPAAGRERRTWFEDDPPNPAGWSRYSNTGLIYDLNGDPTAVFEPQGQEGWNVWTYDAAAPNRRGLPLGTVAIERGHRGDDDDHDDDDDHGGNRRNYWFTPSWLPAGSDFRQRRSGNWGHRRRRSSPFELITPAGTPPAQVAPRPESYEMDFNQFLAEGDSIRVLLWKEE